ncbi:hypothetical protein O6H91_19G015400 [Diphasiastrum complanatum]|uniref:Uncharacterized protein n=1 Tax=Diphasiastrum complanatum TaxID=34168 RepID=A0ACC2AT78_DIPCM|nr:hypothetical protein O6H91_19G015400 [Diphasiastrum complanatum]
MAWSQALRRRFKVFMVALAVFLDYKAIQKKEKLIRKQKRDALWERAHERNANRVLKTITELEGLWVKAGQYLSTRADVLPNAYIRLLRQLQDSLPPRPLSEVYATIEEELGKSPKELFTDFDNVPMATASIAQVHRARTKDGVDVVVKVQHRGIKECILQDLENARTVVRWIAWAEPQYDFGPVLDEWCAEVPKELDFNLEADNTRKVAHNLSHNKDQIDSSTLTDVDVLVPEVVQQSSEKVLLLAYMDGVRLSDVDALDILGVNKQDLVESITRAYAHQIYVDGFFNADPHPGNFLVSKEAPFRPVLLDFGLTKALTSTTKQALAKMLLACAEGDYAALLSAFSEMGLKLRLDMPEEAMQITNFFFRRSTPAKEALDESKTWIKEREERMKRIQERMQEENDRKSLNRNPVDAFPGEAVFFMRVLNLLRGLSSMLGARVAYLEVMRPYAESALSSGNLTRVGQQLQSYNWIHSNPVLSEVEQKLRNVLLSMGQNQRILGIQVCAYKDGKVIIDTAAGVLGRYDPRPVQPDSLFPVFSATKGVTAALVHWLADHGKLKLEDEVSKYWPEFAVNGKASCTVANVLNHTAGLQNAMSDALKENPLLACDWDKMLQDIASIAPQSTPGSEQKYHALSFGWLCGGIIEKAGGKNFQGLLEEALVKPLGVTGEFYIGIPPGVESRLASLTLSEELRSITANSQTVASLSQGIQSSEQQDSNAPKLTGVLNTETFSAISTMPAVFNTLFIRRAIIPSANGHFSARALARFYAMLASGGIIPPLQSSSKPPLGSHLRYPSISTEEKSKKKSKAISSKRLIEVTAKDSQIIPERKFNKVFKNPKIHDAFIGIGNYRDLITPDGPFGLGFQRFVNGGEPNNYANYTFGHSGVGGSLGYCDPSNAFSIAITVNQMALGQVTRDIVHFVCSELGLPCPSQFTSSVMAAPAHVSVKS